MKRLLIELAIIAAVIAFGWNKPFGERMGHTAYKVNSTLDEMGGSIRKTRGSLRAALPERPLTTCAVEDRLT